jgi:hypothetical protein
MANRSIALVALRRLLVQIALTETGQSTSALLRNSPPFIKLSESLRARVADWVSRQEGDSAKAEGKALRSSSHWFGDMAIAAFRTSWTFLSL